MFSETLQVKRLTWESKKILFSPNVPRRRKRFICGKLGINATNNLGRYLGFPLLQQGKPSTAFNFVVKKIQSKLAGWKTKLLSKAKNLCLSKQQLP